MSRFKIHDDESAPEAAVPILKGVVKSGGQVPNLLGVLANAPAALRGYVRMRGELRNVTLPRGTQERIALAVAAHHRAEPDLSVHSRAAQREGVGLDEIARAQEFTSADPAQAALLAWLRPLVERREPVPVHLHEAALEAGWTEEQLVEAIAVVALESFAAMVDVAGDVPVDGSGEETRQLRAVA
ncbi:MAG TPA: carboxymuconolactone decarboxylase family protein [Solirubrobacteraceae bacterium]|nr:carboxymuconolactone decarboxylase family protein [Solirubrobacteraceae bacterium]